MGGISESPQSGHSANRVTDIRQALTGLGDTGRRLGEILLERRVDDSTVDRHLLAEQRSALEEKQKFGSGLRAAVDRSLHGTPIGHDRPTGTHPR